MDVTEEDLEILEVRGWRNVVVDDKTVRVVMDASKIEENNASA